MKIVRRICLLSAVVVWVGATALPAAVVSTAPQENKPRPLPGDYLTDHEKDYFQGNISTWAYYASPLFAGGNPANENLSFWDCVDYELIFFPNFPLSSYAMIKDLTMDWWWQMGMTWHEQIYVNGIQQQNTVRGRRNICLGLLDGFVDGFHELFDAIKVWDGHWKLPFHPGCTFEGGTRALSFFVNAAINRTKPVKPVYYALYPIGRTTELVAKGFNSGFLIGIKVCKWPPMLLENMFFGGYDLITWREHRKGFENKRLPFSFKSGCVFYMYDGDMDYRRGPEKAPSKPPRKPRRAMKEKK